MILLLLSGGGGPAPPSFSGTIPDLSVTKNTGVHQFDLGDYFSNVTTYSIAPSLPIGMSLDTSTGVLTIDSDAADAGVTGGYVVSGT